MCNLVLRDDDVAVDDSADNILVAVDLVNKEDETCSTVTIKYDSACSRNMSGVSGRLVNEKDTANIIQVKGFNGNISLVDSVGQNDDGKLEYYVRSMPSDMVLLCAHDYAKDGAAVLMEDSGVVIRLTPQEKEKLQQFIGQFHQVKQLTVNNRTYEVVQDNDAVESMIVSEEAMSNTATRYFNSKVHVSNTTECVLAMLLTGLSFKDLYAMVQAGIQGIPREITIQTLNAFEHKYGRTPDVLQMATPTLAGNVKGYMSLNEQLTRVGQRVEADFFQADFNESKNIEGTDQQRVVKLATHGGATAAYIAVDAYSGMPHGWLVKTVADSVTHVKRSVDRLATDGHSIDTFAADQGIMTQSKFRVMVPETLKYLENQHIKTQCGEAYNHDNGVSHAERNIRTVKELIRFAVLYCINNPNFSKLQFTKQQIFMLWGDLYYWALMIIALKPCTKHPDKTKFEVYYGKAPDLRDIRLLPIFAVVYILKHSKSTNPMQANREYWQRGLYVGPSDNVKGAIRVATLTRQKQIQVTTTTTFKGVSDGGSIDNYKEVESATTRIIAQLMPTDDLPIVLPIPEQGIEELLVPAQFESDTMSNTESDSRGAEAQTTKQNRQVRISDADKMKHQVQGWGTREERAERKHQQEQIAAYELIQQQNNKRKKSVIRETAMTVCELLDQIAEVQAETTQCKFQETEAKITEESNFVDWSTHEEDMCYFSFTDNTYVTLTNSEAIEQEEYIEEGYRAVTEGVPRSFEAALRDPVWGDPARKELSTLKDITGALVQVDQVIAHENIRNGADVLTMIAVYEEKVKNGEVVKKVRLVADGRKHKNHGPTYSPTPSREHFLVLLHIFAALGWDYYWIDEQRAFLKADRQDKRPIYARFTGIKELYGVNKAVYGTKDASRDYHIKVDDTLVQKLLCERLHLCQSIYVKQYENAVVIVFDYVDDFIFGGDDNNTTEKLISEFRKYAETDEPIQNSPLVLGMEIERDKERKIILVRMTQRIKELADKYPQATEKTRNVPMPMSGYLVRDYELDALPEKKKREATAEEKAMYMSIVGSLIWIQGVRLDIIFAVLYLTWFTRSPLQHHLDMAFYVIGYLFNTQDMPLILGGDEDINVDIYYDASHGTAPKSRSVSGYLGKLHPQSGAITAKAHAQSTVKLSSFESEIDNVTSGFKLAKQLTNVLYELKIKTSRPAATHNDNQAMIEFVKGNSMVKGARHMELRQFYTREEFQKGNVTLEYMPGIVLPADKLTKLGNVTEHEAFASNIMGLNLLSYDYFIKIKMKTQEGLTSNKSSTGTKDKVED